MHWHLFLERKIHCTSLDIKYHTCHVTSLCLAIYSVCVLDACTWYLTLGHQLFWNWQLPLFLFLISNRLTVYKMTLAVKCKKKDFMCTFCIHVQYIYISVVCWKDMVQMNVLLYIHVFHWNLVHAFTSKTKIYIFFYNCCTLTLGYYIHYFLSNVLYILICSLFC